MKICSNCSADTFDNQRFCTSCGSQAFLFPDGDSSADQSQQPKPAADFAENPSQQSQLSPQNSQQDASQGGGSDSQNPWQNTSQSNQPNPWQEGSQSRPTGSWSGDGGFGAGFAAQDNNQQDSQNQWQTPSLEEQPKPQEKVKGKSLAITALVLGLVAFLLPVPYLDIACGVAAIVLVIVSAKMGYKKEIWIPAVIFSIVGTVNAVIYTILTQTGVMDDFVTNISNLFYYLFAF